MCLITDIPTSPPSRVEICELEGEEELDETLKFSFLKPTQEIAQIIRKPVYNPLVGQWMEKMKFVPGQGLGKINQGITKPLDTYNQPRKIRSRPS